MATRVYQARECVVCSRKYAPRTSNQKVCGGVCRRRHVNNLRKKTWPQTKATSYLRKYRKTGQGRLNCKIAKLRNSAKNRGLVFELDQDWLRAQWELQEGRCALTGFPMVWFSDLTQNQEPFLLSVDRIDSQVGYTPENCRLVCHQANTMKNHLSDAELRVWVAALHARLAEEVPCR